MPTVKLDSIADVPALQTRKDGVSDEVVKEYAAAVAAGAKFPPLLAYRVTDKKYKGPALVSGFHRKAAYELAGVTEAEVEIREGTFAEAWVAAFRSNTQHGARYSNADKRQCAERALRLFPTESCRQIADRMGLSHDFLTRVRKALEATGQIEKVEKVTGRDGREQAKSKERSGGDSTQVSSDDTCQEFPSEQHDDDRNHVDEAREEASEIEGATEPDGNEGGDGMSLFDDSVGITPVVSEPEPPEPAYVAELNPQPPEHLRQIIEAHRLITEWAADRVRAMRVVAALKCLQEIIDSPE